MRKLRPATGRGIMTLIALCALLAFHFHTCSRSDLAAPRQSTTTAALPTTNMAWPMRTTTEPLPAATTTHQAHEQSLLPKHRLRVLLGIFTADLESEEKMRQRHRDLFALWNDDRVCVLHEFQTQSPGQKRERCELVYTFVMGANPHATTELVDDSLRPMLVSRPIAGVGRDINDPGILLLNIRENMNDGKSQTWLYYGAQLAQQYDLDYVIKCDSDTVLSLHDFFRFAYVNLPPAPYNSNMLVGIPWSKSDWGSSDRTDETERHFRDYYNGVHIYAAGQLYILSTDLARAVGDEARSLQGKCSYCSPHEDHDVSTMAYHSKRPVKFMMMGYHQIYWQHWVKHDDSGYDRIWEREKARMQGLSFEGQILTTKSRYDDVVT
jgi:hypothetical protein